MILTTFASLDIIPGTQSHVQRLCQQPTGSRAIKRVTRLASPMSAEIFSDFFLLFPFLMFLI
jgi:hypothetical protein